MQVLIFIAIILSAVYFGIIIYYRFAFSGIRNQKLDERHQTLGERHQTSDDRQLANEEALLTLETRFVETNQPTNQSTNPQSLIPNSPITNQPTNPSTKLSIIIPARNEAANIENCINSILANNYPKHLLEIIVVDDHSDDETTSLVKKYALQNVQLILLKDFVTDRLNSYKKKAIEVAVSKARGTLIVTTDADCIVPLFWLQTIVNFYEETNAQFIAAPVSILPSPSGESLSRPFGRLGVRWFIEIFQALDFMTLQGITAAVVHKKQMTMCNGANMAYQRTAFYEVSGFAGIDNIASGDDMLLMHKIYKKYPDKVLYLHAQEAIVQTAPVKTIKEFLNQRIRWASKADKYDDKRILPVLVVVYLFNLILFSLPFIALVNNEGFSIATYQLSTFITWAILFLGKTIVELFFLYPVAKFFNKEKLLWLFPIMQPFHILYTLIAGWLGKFGSYVWKERVVK